MSMQLQHNYAHIIPETGECISCITTSYVINHPEWIEVDVAHDDYIGKYYNSETGLWYLEPEFITQWELS